MSQILYKPRTLINRKRNLHEAGLLAAHAWAAMSAARSQEPGPPQTRARARKEQEERRSERERKEWATGMSAPHIEEEEEGWVGAIARLALKQQQVVAGRGERRRGAAHSSLKKVDS